MTKAKFYRLPDGSDSGLLLIIDELLQFAKTRQIDALILTEDEEHARKIFEGLQESTASQHPLFLAELPQQAFSVCWQVQPGNHHGLLINLTAELPVWFSRFDFLAELIEGEEHFVEQKRNNFKLLRNRGYPIQFADMTKDLRFTQASMAI